MGKSQKKSNLNSDWLVFRQLRNTCTLKIRKAKSDHFLSQTTHNLNNPSQFWKIIKSLSENSKGQELPSSIVTNSLKVTDKAKMLDCFNEHFKASGFLFQPFGPQHVCVPLRLRLLVLTLLFCLLVSVLSKSHT